MKIYNNITELVGKTPIVRLKRYEKLINSKAELYAKLESFNPLCSVKDRIALAMIESLEQQNLITKETILVEPTSGNTGIGLAFVAAAKGIKIKIVMPDTMSKERIIIMEALGAEVILTPGGKGMTGAIQYAQDLANLNPSVIIPQQFENPTNPQVHRETTALEIIEVFEQKLDFFIAGVGTGGTITGVGEVLKKYSPQTKVIAVEPSSSPVLSKGISGSHKIQGLGAGFIPKVLNLKIIDEVMMVENEAAFAGSRILAKAEGILVGISSGAVLDAASRVAIRPENKNKKILMIFPDSGERYLTTELFRRTEDV